MYSLLNESLGSSNGSIWWDNINTDGGFLWYLKNTTIKILN